MTKKTKPKSILDAVRDAAAGYRPNGGTWFDSLPLDVKEELLLVRKTIQEGKIYGPKVRMAEAIVQLCADRGHRTCSPKGVMVWLRQKD